MIDRICHWLLVWFGFTSVVMIALGSLYFLGVIITSPLEAAGLWPDYNTPWRVDFRDALDAAAPWLMVFSASGGVAVFLGMLLAGIGRVTEWIWPEQTFDEYYRDHMNKVVARMEAEEAEKAQAPTEPPR